MTEVSHTNFIIHILVSGESVPLVVNTTSTELMCTVETDQDVASIMWKRNDLVLNNTEKYMISKANDSRSSTIKITKPGMMKIKMCQILKLWIG